MVTVSRHAGGVPTGICDRCRRDADFRNGTPRLALLIRNLEPDKELSEIACTTFLSTVSAAADIIAVAHTEDDLAQRLRSLYIRPTSKEALPGMYAAILVISKFVGLQIL
jgi:hypothetical protein